MLPERDSREFRTLLHDEVEKRRTFAIISHPDAGKTTLTEKLLLYNARLASSFSRKGIKDAAIDAIWLAATSIKFTCSFGTIG